MLGGSVVNSRVDAAPLGCLAVTKLAGDLHRRFCPATAVVGGQLVPPAGQHCQRRAESY